MRKLLGGLLLAAACAAQSFPEGDPAAAMVEGISRWLLRETAGSATRRAPSREKLRHILGVVDARVPFDALDLTGTTKQPALLMENEAFRVSLVRWPVLDGITAEGLYFEPRARRIARVVALPDADQLPETFAAARALAASGCEVLAPVLIDRNNTWAGNPRFRMTNQSHREFIYRMAFMVGRHIWGYEAQKALSAVDWFASQPVKLPIGIWGYGEGGAVALFAAALDERIAAAGVSGYFAPREDLWQQPIDRNAFGLLKDFGDAELASMIAPRTLVIDGAPGPIWNSWPETSTRRGAAPGRLAPAPAGDIGREAARARLTVSADGMASFVRALGGELRIPPAAGVPVRDAAARQHRQFDEMVAFTQKLVRDSQQLRDATWTKADNLKKPEEWQPFARRQRARLWDEVIGRLPASTIPLNARLRKTYPGARWDGYEVFYDVLPGVMGYGVLLVPKDIRPGERRPVLVGQHGLEGRPQHLFGQEEKDRDGQRYTNFHFYQNLGDRFAGLGYVVYLPQNPYIGDFRKINRLANPLGLSMFSFILAQQERLLDWLSSLDYVDSTRIGFYGLSYGGKTAVRIPPLIERFALSVCSGDFNAWIAKVAGYDMPFNYVYTQEYEMGEFNLAAVADHGEMAKLMAPRPFMVERGHRDGVGIDEWVAAEFAKVKRFYDEMGIGDRAGIEYFNGPHMIHGVGTVAFVRKYLGR